MSAIMKILRSFFCLPIVVTLVFVSIEGRMLGPLLWRYKWAQPIWLAYCCALGYWATRIDAKKHRGELKWNKL